MKFQFPTILLPFVASILFQQCTTIDLGKIQRSENTIPNNGKRPQICLSIPERDKLFVGTLISPGGFFKEIIIDNLSQLYEVSSPNIPCDGKTKTISAEIKQIQLATQKGSILFLPATTIWARVQIDYKMELLNTPEETSVVQSDIVCGEYVGFKTATAIAAVTREALIDAVDKTTRRLACLNEKMSCKVDGLEQTINRLSYPIICRKSPGVRKISQQELFTMVENLDQNDLIKIHYHLPTAVDLDLSSRKVWTNSFQ